MSSTPKDQVLGDSIPLEDRLRGLILNNSQPASLPPTVVGAVVPPHMVGASESDLEDYRRRQVSQELQSELVPTGQSQHGGRKKLNQAQRRQMNSQLSIPIDPRPDHQGNQRGRGFSPSTGFSLPPRHYGQPKGRQNRTKNSSHQHNTPFQGPLQTPVYPPREHFQQLPTHSIINQGHITQQGHPRQFPPTPRSPLPNDFYPNRALEHHNVRMPYPHGVRPAPQHSRLYQPGSYGSHGYRNSSSINPEQISMQSAFLEVLVNQHVPNISISNEEILEKERFRATIEQICRDVILNLESDEHGNPDFSSTSIELKCFGSMASGFATKGSDMDLALLTPNSKPPPDSPKSAIPRLLEKRLLEMGFGARLLTRTRVPIIKLCELPTDRLMSDLLEERKKWENGFTSNDAMEDEGVIEEADADCEVLEKGSNETAGEDAGKSPTAAYVKRLASLQQKPKESLIDYYGSANRLLRKLGSRDIDKSRDIPQEQARIVTDVCRAFINGLADVELKERLSSYQSLSFSDSTNPRSLRGIFTEVEGEQLAMAWDSRPLQEATEKLDADCQRQIEDWRKLLNRTNVEPIMYNGMLHQAVSRLKRIASLQLLFLEQGLHESPLQYHGRVANILDRLRSQNYDHVLCVMITHYINGIRNHKVQEALRAKATSNEFASLHLLALQHRILQLADDYETALSKNHYSELHRADIEQYISFLRSVDVNHIAWPSSSNPVAPLRMDKPNAHFIAKLRGLPDPSYILHKPRDRSKDHLEFPKENIGIQCDINFSAQLGLHNTLLLRCYALSDSRVRPMILFIKYWARVRGINTPYRGTLSSYGYVLMALHYLINIVTPFVCQNLQELQRDPPPHLPPDEIANQTTCNGYDVRFWRDEKEIASLAERGMLNHNQDSVGKLLRGFYEYYAQSGPLSTGGRGFDWGREVLSLSTLGGIRTKQEKGWVGARTVTETRTEAAPAATYATKFPSAPNSDQVSPTLSVVTTQKLVTKEEVKEIRHRYLFAIEDPFELDHNVARTVTHNGIVAIRDEFRRAWKIINNVGKGTQEGFLDQAIVEAQSSREFEELMDLMHGKMGEVHGAI